jgi:hypothetical protein
VEAAKTCAVCGGPKAPKTCGLCEASICKTCQEILGSEAFLYMNPIPENLRHVSYCVRCYDEQVAAPLAAYEAMADKARNVYFLTQDYKGYVRIMSRHKIRISIDDCDDRRETILKLAYRAAELGFNAIIQSRVESVCVNAPGGYQSSRWKASALPAIIDGEQLERSSLLRL